MGNDMKQALGMRIRASRRLSRLTQEQLAERVEKSVQTISSIERGIYLPGLDTLQAIASALNVPVGSLLEDVSTASSRRQQKEFEGTRILQLLSDADLDIALDQLRAWSRN
jgi:transcriptional regulator with XRE-family HTH domain